MTLPRPETLEEYTNWAKNTLNFDFADPTTRNRYEVNVGNAQNAIQGTSFLRNLSTFLSQCNADCELQTGAGLLLATELNVLKKPYDSAVEKSFRINVIKNWKFPLAPKNGWVTPDNWFTRFDDLVRGTLICKFLDGPQKLSELLDDYAVQCGLQARHEARSTEDGYYAFHQYTRFTFDIVDHDWQRQTITTEFEIQLTTQLQEVLRQLTHPLYEAKRLKPPDRDERWKWDHDTARFRTSYLGHSLHLIEAIIVQVRNSTITQSAAEPSTMLASSAPNVQEAAPATSPETPNENENSSGDQSR